LEKEAPLCKQPENTKILLNLLLQVHETAV
jgi:hypothetical protein